MLTKLQHTQCFQNEFFIENSKHKIHFFVIQGFVLYKGASNICLLIPSPRATEHWCGFLVNPKAQKFLEYRLKDVENPFLIIIYYYDCPDIFCR